MRRIPRGFTIVELLVVIAIIGILATITFIGFSRYQADTRDSQRSSEATIISEALEKYYDKNGEYPSCSAMQASGSTVAATLGNIDQKVLLTPQASSTKTNSIDFCTDITTATATDSFAYVGDGSPACATGNACLMFKLEYKSESTGSIQSISSRRTTDIATSTAISDLSATPFSFSQINLGWTASGGASSYNIRYATNSSMTSPTTFTPAATTNSASVTGLTLATQYWLQVQPVSATGATGAWSNTATATTYTLGTPVCTATTGASPMTQLQCSWSAITNATSYTLEYANNSGFTGQTTVTNATSPYVVSGLSAGTTLYFHVKSVAAGNTSGWSATASATTILPAPVCNTSTVNSNTQVTVSWTASSGAITYSLDYATDSGFTSPSSITGITTTSKAVTGLSNGTNYYFRIKAVNGSVVSTWGSCPSAATGVDGPTSVGWSADAYAVRNYAGLPWMPGADPGYGSTWWTNGMNIYGTCQPGATVVTRLYSYYAYSNNTSQNGATLMDWTWNNQDRYVVSGSGSWMVWWQGWVACQVGGTRAGDTYLGNAGPY